ncbi:MAG: hypothetical protein WDZ45_02650 [Flavobacteriaceae bacterium]
METYRQEIIKTYKYLCKARQNILERTINFAMKGPLQKVNSVFREGDTYQFQIEQFKGTGDATLDLLIALNEKLDAVIDSLANLHTITENELDEAVDWDPDDYEEF